MDHSGQFYRLALGARLGAPRGKRRAALQREAAVMLCPLVMGCHTPPL